jgi:hypothetical protein
MEMWGPVTILGVGANFGNFFTGFDLLAFV